MFSCILWRRCQQELYVASTIPQNNQQQIVPIERGITVRDLGVIVDEILNFKEHINSKINMAYKMVGVIKRNFKYLSLSSFVLVYKSCQMPFGLL